MRKAQELNDPTSCINQSRDDEMVFVLCARDPHAPGAVQHWATAYEAAGGRAEKVWEARAAAAAMVVWREEQERYARVTHPDISDRGMAAAWGAAFDVLGGAPSGVDVEITPERLAMARELWAKLEKQREYYPFDLHSMCCCGALARLGLYDYGTQQFGPQRQASVESQFDRVSEPLFDVYVCKRCRVVVPTGEPLAAHECPRVARLREPA